MRSTILYCGAAAKATAATPTDNSKLAMEIAFTGSSLERSAHPRTKPGLYPKMLMITPPAPASLGRKLGGPVEPLFLSLRGGFPVPKPECQRHHNQHQRHLHDQPRNNGNRKRLLH